MGQASTRRRERRDQAAPAASRPPFVVRPFAGLPGETEWVALREILPAATATLTIRPDAVPGLGDATVEVATALPSGWAGLHRASGDRVIAVQSGSGTGDLSRDLAAALLATAAAEPGSPVPSAPAPTADAARLQDLVDLDAELAVRIHPGFDFWVADADMDDPARAALDRANAAIVPTLAVPGAPSVTWCRMTERCYVRWVLPHDEDASTDALARLHARGQDTLGAGTRLLGAFRACGLLVPVWEVEPSARPDDLAPAVARLAPLLAEAAQDTTALDSSERGARNGLVTRQVTLR